jgi:hypothetical protein
VTDTLVGVCPAAERARRARLFDALEEAFPVRFEGRGPDCLSDLDGLVTFGPGGPGGPAEGVWASRPHLQLVADEARDAGEPVPIELARTPLLPSMLAGQTISETGDPVPVPVPEPGAVILATRAGAPVWSARTATGGGTMHIGALAPLELGAQEALRDRLATGRFLALLPMVRFLQELTSEEAYTPPPPRACFVLDDPNLHAPSYGYVDFRALARHATAHDYHVSMAMIPIDGWFAHPAMVRLFRESAATLSISMHGNDHIGGELERARSESDARALLAQALRRVARFERHHDVSVCRVMAPPHGLCSEQTARQMVPLGFEALSVSRPYPWHARRPMRWTARPPGTSPLAGWFPTDVVAGGLPILLRLAFTPTPDDLPLRAFLGQPLILCGHHEDLAGGMDILGRMAEQINALGDVQWTSMTSIARSSFCTRREGSTLHVRPFVRRIRLDVPSGIDRIVVEVPASGRDGEGERVVCPDGRGSVEIALAGPGAIDPASIRASTRRPDAFVRRLVTEGRDRLLPLMDHSGTRQKEKKKPLRRSVVGRRVRSESEAPGPEDTARPD